MTMSQIFVAKGFGQRGPYSEKEVHELLLQGEFSWDDLAWREGIDEWKELRAVLPAELEAMSVEVPVKPAFHHVALWKFVFLSIVTFGFYQLYWFYRSWRFVKEEEQSRIFPFWRTVFTPIWFYPLAVRIFRKEGSPRSFFAGILAIAYFLVGAAWQLPNLLSFISLGNFLFVVPLVLSVDRFNRRNGVVGPAYRRFGWLHGMVTIAGMPFVAMLAIVLFKYYSAERLIDGAELSETDEQFLRGNEILPSGESVILFYAADLLEPQWGGHFFTEKRVVSFHQETGELWMDEVLWKGIEAIDRIPSIAEIGGPAVTLFRSDGSDFTLYLAEDEEENEQFIEAMTEYWNGQRAEERNLP